MMNITYDLTGLEPSGTGGLHIHVGMSCDTPDAPGGHFWTPTDAFDVWKDVQYTADGTTVTGSAIVPAGYDFSDNNGHAVVVHSAADSSRVSCGTLSSKAGLHIHTGVTCADASLVGGHYWDNVNIVDDPWNAIKVEIEADGTATGSDTLIVGFD